MKALLHLIFWGWIMTLNGGCTSHTDKVTSEVRQYYHNKKVTFDKALKRCLILPEVGCSGCIAAGIYVFKENDKYFYSTQRENMVIFTSIHSKKMLFRTLELSSLDDYYCCLDTTDIYLTEGNNSIYPLVLYLKEGEIIRAGYQSPESGDILENFEKELRK